MTVMIYDYSGIISLKGYNGSSKIYDVDEGDIDTFVKGLTFTKFAVSTMAGKGLFTSLYDAQSKSRIGLTVQIPNGNIIDLGNGNRVSSTEENLYYLIDYEWNLSQPLSLNDTGNNKIHVVYNVLR